MRKGWKGHIRTVVKDGKIVAYQVRWYDAGVNHKKTFHGITKQEADQQLRDILSRRARGEPLPDHRSAPSVATVAEHWFEEGRPHWKPSTRQQYRQLLDDKVLPTFGEQRVTSGTAAQIGQWVAGLRAAGLSARRTNITLVILKGLFKRAQRDGLLSRNPADPIRLLKEPQVEIDPLAPEEVTAFLAVCPPFWRPYFTVAFWTGARPGELAALKWGDVDWSHETFRIRAARRRGIEGEPKTKSSIRDVEMSDEVVQALHAQRKEQLTRRAKAGLGAPEPGKDYIFTGPHGGFLNANDVRDRVWYPTLKKVGLRRRIVYQTRHTFASNALAAGASPLWVSGMLGHTTPEMPSRSTPGTSPTGPGATAAPSPHACAGVHVPNTSRPAVPRRAQSRRRSAKFSR